MKFDIVKYIADNCNDYFEGHQTKADTLSAIAMALKNDSWQYDCDGKEVIDEFVKTGTGRYWMWPTWCIEDAEDDK